MGLSVAIVAMNEEADIGRALESVRWADEIVLVDSGSTDRTREIAHEYRAKVVVEPWRGYAAQKNFAIGLCTQAWVLSLDADEELSPELTKEIRAILDDPAALKAYFIPRKNLFMGRWMRHGGYYPDPYLRLFRAGCAVATGPDFRDHMELKDPNGPPAGRCRNALIHYAYPTLSYYIERVNRYSTLSAATVVANGRKNFSVFDFILRPTAAFVQNYFFRLGFLDGREGLLLHLNHAVYVANRYAKAWELGRNAKRARV